MFNNIAINKTFPPIKSVLNENKKSGKQAISVLIFIFKIHNNLFINKIVKKL